MAPVQRQHLAEICVGCFGIQGGPGHRGMLMVPYDVPTELFLLSPLLGPELGPDTEVGQHKVELRLSFESLRQ